MAAFKRIYLLLFFFVLNTLVSQSLWAQSGPGELLDRFVYDRLTDLANPTVILEGPDQDIYVASVLRQPSELFPQVMRYDRDTGELVDIFVDKDRSEGRLTLVADMDFGPGGDLFVMSFSGIILQYAAETGAYLGVFLNPIQMGYQRAHAMEFTADGFLYVAGTKQNGAATVEVFDAETGAYVRTVVDVGAEGIAQMKIGPDGHVYTMEYRGKQVLRYHGETGALIDVFIPPNYTTQQNIKHFVFGPDDHLYVSKYEHPGLVSRYNIQTGARIDVFVQLEPATEGRLDAPEGLLFGSDGLLYVSDEGSSNILRYDGTSGAYVDVFVEPSGGSLSRPNGITFGAQGELLVIQSNLIKQYDGDTGLIQRVFEEPNAPRPSYASNITIGPDGDVYVCGSEGVLRFDKDSGATRGRFTQSDRPCTGNAAFGPSGDLFMLDIQEERVLRFNGSTGELMGEFVSPGSGGLVSSEWITFGPDGHLYVSNYSQILRYDGSTGAFIDVFINYDAVFDAKQIMFGPDGHLYILMDSSQAIRRYHGETGAFIDSFVPINRDRGVVPGPFAFGPDDHLYMLSENEVLRFQKPGALIRGTIEFNINMSGEIFYGRLDPGRGDTVAVAGNVGLLDSRTYPFALADPDGDQVYSGTIELMADENEQIEYVFYHISADNAGARYRENEVGPGSRGSRVLAFNGDTQLPVVFFNNITNVSTEDPIILDNPLAPIVNYPNPFSHKTTILYELPEGGEVQLTVYDVLGQQVLQFPQSWQAAGTHEIEVERGDLAAGLYMYRVTTSGAVHAGRMVVVD